VDNNINLEPVLDFLIHIQDNNNREWFEENRIEYQLAKKQFENLIDRVIDEFKKTEDLGDITAKDCVMRIFRDMRFSKDKSPYQTHFSAAIAIGGKKSLRMPYYLQIAPSDRSFIAGGLYMPTSSQLGQFRKSIDRNSKSFKAIINAKAFKDIFGDLSGEKLKTVPQGYHHDHKDIEILRMKQVIASHSVSDKTVLSKDFSNQIVEAFTELKPMLDYLNDCVVTINQN